MIWSLFLTFLKIGFVSFGGGFSVLPLIQYEVADRGWLSGAEIQQAVSLAGMAPGPIAVNSATLIGYQSFGFAGAAAATLGMILPSLIVVVLLTLVFLRFQQNRWLKSSFYGLRPVITGLIVYAAIHFGFLGNGRLGFTWQTAATLGICAGSLFVMLKYKLHPFAVIIAAGAAGIILF